MSQNAGFALTKTTTKGAKVIDISTDKATLRKAAIAHANVPALSDMHANAALKHLKECGYSIDPITWTPAAA